MLKFFTTYTKNHVKSIKCNILYRRILKRLLNAWIWQYSFSMNFFQKESTLIIKPYCKSHQLLTLQYLLTVLLIPLLYDSYYLFSRYEFQITGRYNPAVLSLIFLSLHLMAQSIMWTAWDYSTWYEKLVGGYCSNSYVEMKVWHTCKTIFQFFSSSNFGPTIICYY